MFPAPDFFDALVMLDTHPRTGAYRGVTAFGCGIKEFIFTGHGILADVDRAFACYPRCVIDGAVSEAVQAAYNAADSKEHQLWT
jgi:hypothetical protein